ncbi:phosphoglycerate mutase [Nitrincola tibetensis]|uniref:Phosphoglycerate mutase n=1 Tax=Nitrincola tibetensis TaxID=2219697 RepID=A0A364NS52_9GAMM|nr:histidine phosphatase family protein [Nitrincola tibetensis]RAU19862.1 phosphoglycerate mutase [Nitrincola tibetensis]
MRYWIRHDRPLLSSHLCYGWLDVPLAVPVQETLAELPNLPIHLPIYTSSLQRCRLLAEALAEGKQSIHCLDALREIHFGQWEGIEWNKISRAELDAWAEQPYAYSFPEGESIPAFLVRVQTLLDELPSEAIVVTHAGVIRAALHFVKQIPLEEAFATPVGYGLCLEF